MYHRAKKYNQLVNVTKKQSGMDTYTLPNVK